MELMPVNPDTSSPLTLDEVRWPDQQPLDDAIRKIVVQDVQKAEDQITSSGLIGDFDEADRLIRAQVPMERWRGTNIPRANLGVPILLEHADSLLPQMTQELFGDDIPFEVTPWPNTDPAKAQGATYILEWEMTRANFEQETELGLYDTLVYGTGVWKWGWCVESNRQRKFGDRSRWGETVARPFFKHVELRHVFVDPALRTCDWRKANWVAHRTYMTPIQLDALRVDDSYMNIPSRNVLVALSMENQDSPLPAPIESNLFDNKPTRATPTTADPLGKPFEVLEYTTPEWIYTILARKVVIRKQKNVWGVIPYCSAPFKLLPGSAYGLGLVHLIGGEQKLQQGMINLYLDNKSLQLNGMFIRRRGANIPAQQLSMRPGGIIDTDNVSEGLMAMPIQDFTGNVFQDLAASDARAQRRTAANEFVTQGGLSQASSITRTAAGVNAIQSAAGSRIQKVVERFSNQVFVPTLEAFHYMNKQLDPKIIKTILTQRMSGKAQVDPREVTGAQLDFKIGAATKLRKRVQLAQALPSVIDYISQHEDSLKTQQKTVNHEDAIYLMLDMAGVGKLERGLIRDMTEEEVQQMMSENPMALKQQEIEWQRAQKGIDHDFRMKEIEQENMGRAGRDVIKSGLKMAEEKESGELQAVAGLAQQMMGGAVVGQ